MCLTIFKCFGCFNFKNRGYYLLFYRSEILISLFFRNTLSVKHLLHFHNCRKKQANYSFKSASNRLVSAAKRAQRTRYHLKKGLMRILACAPSSCRFCTAANSASVNTWRYRFVLLHSNKRTSTQNCIYSSASLRTRFQSNHRMYGNEANLRKARRASIKPLHNTWTRRPWKRY